MKYTKNDIELRSNQTLLVYVHDAIESKGFACAHNSIYTHTNAPEVEKISLSDSVFDFE